MKNEHLAAVAIWLTPLASLAEYHPDDYLRFSTGYSHSSLELDTPDSQFSQSVSSLPLTIEYQSSTGFYSGIGYARNTVEEIEVDYVTYVVDEDYSQKGVFIGYRFPMNEYSDNGEYAGIAYLAVWSSGSDDTSNMYSIYSESDVPQYYGRVALSYQLNDTIELFTLSGTHVWFIDPAFGLGYTWGIGFGNADLESEIRADAAIVEFGVVIMFREYLY